MPQLMKRLSGIFKRSRAFEVDVPDDQAASLREAMQNSDSSEDLIVPGSIARFNEQSESNCVSDTCENEIATDVDENDFPVDVARDDHAIHQDDSNSSISTDGVSGVIELDTDENANGGGRIARFRERTSRSMQQKRYDKLVDMIERVGNHLDTQAQRSDRMIDILDRIPNQLESLSEIQRNSNELVQTITQRFEQQTAHEGQMRDIMLSLSQATDKQAEVLDGMREQMSRYQDREDQVVGTLQGFQTTLDGLDESTRNSTTVLGDLAGSVQEEREAFGQAINRHSKIIIILAVMTGVVSISGLGAVIVMLFRIFGAG